MVSYFLFFFGGGGFWPLRVSSMSNGTQGHPLSGSRSMSRRPWGHTLLGVSIHSELRCPPASRSSLALWMVWSVPSVAQSELRQANLFEELPTLLHPLRAFIRALHGSLKQTTTRLGAG